MTSPAARLQAEDLYIAYADAIDGGRVQDWPQFFADPCLYKIVTAENLARGLPLGMMHCDSLGMVKDRAVASAKLNVFAPRLWRHMISNVRILADDGEALRARANFLVIETPVGKPPHVLAVGQSDDVLVRRDGGLLFRERICVCDNDLIQGSIVFPI